MLSEEKRKQLDGIVVEMAKKNAPQQDVQMIVNDFKAKYDNKQRQISQPQEKGFLENQFSSEGKTPVENFNIGVGKGALSTLDKMAEIGHDVIDPLATKTLNAIGIDAKPTPFVGLPETVTKPEGTTQKIGHGGEQIGEWFIPTTATAKLIKVANSGIEMSKLAALGESGKMASKALSFLTRSGILAGEAYGLTKIQTYNDENSGEQAKMNAIISGALPTVGIVYEKGAKPLFSAVGKKIQYSVIRPTAKDLKDGFNIENVGKYGVGGTLQQMSERTQIKLTELNDQLGKVISDADGKINLNSLIDEVEKEFATSGTKTFGFNTKLGKAMQTFREEVAMIAPDGNVNIQQAQEIKRAVGKLGAWQFGMRDPESSAIENVANSLYSKLKQNIEKVSPDVIKDINKQMSDLIPIENAIIRRIPVAERQNIISLSDILTAAPMLIHPGNWWIAVLNRLSKSGAVGNVLEKAGKKTKEEGGALKTILFGPKEGAVLTPTEQKMAGTVKTVLDKSANMPMGLSLKDVSGGKSGYAAAKTETFTPGPLTTKLLKKLEGRSEVSKQFISDLTNAPDLKQTEKDVIRQVLQSEGDKINVADFGKKVESELLPLKIKSTGVSKPRIGETVEQFRARKKLEDSGTFSKYEGVSLPSELRGEVKDYAEHIYESPIKTSAGSIHFNGATNNYFGHTRVEDIAPEWKVGNTTYKNKSEAKIFGDNPVEQPKTRRVIEVQSDLYQRGRLENEAVSDLAKKEFNNNKNLTYTEAQELALKNEEKLAVRNKELSKLQQYSNPTAHFRMVREEIKRAADDGVEKLQFPTGETGMKIEGLNNQEIFRNTENFNFVKPEDLKVGLEVDRGAGSGGDWVVTDVLGDGKFKAVPKDSIYYLESLPQLNPDIQKAVINNGIKKIEGKPTDKIYNSFLEKDGVIDEIKSIKEGLDLGDISSIADESRIETFDISGKVDTNNPIYKFYEKELGRYLKNNFDAKLVTDKQGVNWMEVTIKQEHKGPVTAFGFGTGKAIAAGLGVSTLASGAAVANQKPKTVTVLNPRYYNEDGSKKEETPKEKEVVKTILAKQENDVVKRLSQWTQGEASTYNPLDPNQTRKGTDGTGAYGRKVERGSIAFGNRYFQDELKAGKKIFIQVEGMEDVKTPYGPGVFRVDDTMNKRYNQKGKFNIDFHPEDFGPERTKKGRFPIKFKIVRIE